MPITIRPRSVAWFVAGICVVAGGDSDTASGDQSSIQGGFNHPATVTRSSISGGSTLTVATTDGWNAG